MALEGESRGININGSPINNIRYADDTAILAPTLEDLQETMDKIEDMGKRFGLKINATKIKLMVMVINAALIDSNVDSSETLARPIAHATNEEILRTAGCERELLNIVKERKVSCLGPIVRGGKYYITKLILQGKIAGCRPGK